VQQAVLYAPFGEIIAQYSQYWHQDKIPEYLFNAKELDEESGMYYYHARYYKPDRFISRDPHFERYFWLSPYSYCANNPVNNIDPDGRDFYDWKGKHLGSSENKDDVHLVSGRQNKKIIKANEKAGKTTDPSEVKVDVRTTKAELTEALHVLKRTEDNGGNSEESSVVTPDGRVIRGEKGKESTGTSPASAELPSVPGNNNTSIHSHRLGLYGEDKKSYASPEILSKFSDERTFRGFRLNIVVGYTKPDETGHRREGAVFYNRNADRIGFMERSSIRRILK